MPIPLPLAATTQQIISIVLSVAGVLVAIGLGVAVLGWMRKRLRQPDTRTPGGFTLSDLRQLVQEGKMTPEEFERAKNLILDANKRALKVKPAQDTTTPKQFPPSALS